MMGAPVHSCADGAGLMFSALFSRPRWFEWLQGTLRSARMLRINDLKILWERAESVWTNINTSWNQIKFASRRLRRKKEKKKKKSPLLKNLLDPSFVNLMQTEITSDDSIIRHHYQHQTVWPGAGGSAASVTGWYGLHFANRPCPPLIFYACQSNTVMTACNAALHAE